MSVLAADPRSRMLAGAPVGERRMRLAGVRTVVLEAGAGRPLLLLQGGIECGGAYWAPVLAGLAAQHRLVVPDLPGLGESEPFARLDAARFDDWLDALITATCDEPPGLVAHSLCGSLAARFAARHGRRLGRLVVYAAPGIGPYRMPAGLRVAAVRFGVRPTARNAERLQRRALHDYDGFHRAEPAWLQAFTDCLRVHAADRHVQRTMRALVRAGTRRVPDADLRAIPVPVALLWGRHDRFVPPAVGARASARLRLPLHVVEDAGHVPHIERPDAFRLALAAALGSEGTPDHPGRAPAPSASHSRAP